MATYIAVERCGYLKPSVHFAAMPARARPQITESNVHPHAPRSAPSRNGVYVPAINR
jgi:hypothetical protein